MNAHEKNRYHTAAFLLLFLLTAWPQVTAPLALLMGFCFSFFIGNPQPRLTAKTSKTLLKLSVVGLGFGVNFLEVIELGKNSLLPTMLFILAALGAGNLLGRVLKVAPNTRTLIAFGTAICGGSAIAAMAPVIKARDEEIAVALATVFSLNAVALLLFPPLGLWLHLSQQQFGLWSALAIHDTSSVVGATATYGAVALTVGTTTKLTRALWIAPSTLVASLVRRSGQRVGVPLFIVGFILAAFASSSLPALAPLWKVLCMVAKQSLVMTLFLVGAGLTKAVFRQVGLRPLLFGVLLWVGVGTTTLGLILTGYLH